MSVIPDEGEWPCQFDPQYLPPPMLVAFLYRLGRDHLPAGVIEQVLIDIRGATYDTKYTNPHLQNQAFQHAGYLTEGYVKDST